MHSRQAASTLIYLFSFSAILCIARIYTRGLIVPMALHASNNLLSALALLSVQT
ncbi:type II CAAX prenyl endopeptidase Rce1 family protein [Superficieibacter sp.]|uniref:CPBP family glutamic-type intramembrane protease n=1 Tax=Superficieibacter sp. TaxID=2303322 RepID=UPI003917FD39